MRLMRLCGVVLLIASARGWQAPKAPPTSETMRQQARAALAVTSGRLRLRGLRESVEVLRDAWGVPHIYAQNQHDLFFAQGFVAAQDRMFQMEIWKRSGQGRLAEVLGPSEIETDRFARLLRYRGDMAAEYASYAPDARSILEAFTSGINAFITQAMDVGDEGGPGARVRLPIEFEWAGFLPGPWKPEDCLSRMAAFSMTGNAGNELENAELLTQLGEERSEQMLRLDPAVALDPAPGLDLAGLSPAILGKLRGSDRRIEFPPGATVASTPGVTLNITGPNGAPPDGSNNWTISGRLTASGHPLLANDPHRTMAVPSLRYITHLVAPGWDVIGAGEPALPGVSIGHNRDIAWGLTIFPVDQQDLYVEELDPQDSTRYRVRNSSDDRASSGAGQDPAGWATMQTETVTIAVKDSPPVQFVLKYTRHGPVLWEDALRHRALSLRWVGSEPGTAGYLASLSLDRARDWSGFLAAMGRWKLPPENMVYADTAGNVGVQSAGLTPIRRWSGLLPVPGAGGYEWRGFIPLAELPRHFTGVSDSASPGFYATANNKTIPANFPYNAGFEWSQWRIDRIKAVLSELQRSRHKITLSDMSALQNDVLSLPARRLLEIYSQDAAHRGSVADGRAAMPEEKLLQGWDGSLQRDSRAAALYELWMAKLRVAVYADMVGNAHKHPIASSPGQSTVPSSSNSEINKQSEAHSDVGKVVSVEVAINYISTPGHRELLKKALAAAGAELRTDWPQWGDLHHMAFRHNLDMNNDAREILDPPPVDRPGDGDTVDSTGWGGSKSRRSSSAWNQTSGASFREILDAGDWDRSVAINVPGESGQPQSPHYSDLLPLWVEGKYFPLLYSKEKVLASSTQRLILEPEAEK